MIKAKTKSQRLNLILNFVQKILRAYLMVLTFMVKIGALLKLFNIVA